MVLLEFFRNDSLHEYSNALRENNEQIESEVGKMELTVREYLTAGYTS